MKHIKKFNEEVLNEIYGKREEWKYDKERFDPNLKELLGAINSIIEESPITFNIELQEKGFNITGPFGISMGVSLDKDAKNNDAVKVYIDKTVIKSANPAQLWDKLERSPEFKNFVKGEKIEKLREGRIKNLIKLGKGKDQKDQNEILLDYLYHTMPEMITNKSDSTGPYATSGTSIRTYKYDLNPLVRAWDTKIPKATFDNKEAQRIYNHMYRKTKKDSYSGEGYWQGKLQPDVKLALEENPLVDVDDLGHGIYDVFMHTTGFTWRTRLEDMQQQVIDRLEFKSRYLVDEKVAQYNVEHHEGGKLALVIKVETTVHYN